jgi:hypothetical protein
VKLREDLLMNRNRISLGAALVLMAGLAIGCYEATFPLDPVPQADTDARLLGRWRCITGNASDEGVRVTVGRAADRRYTVAVQERDKEPDRYEGYASSLNGTTVMNLKDLDGGAKPWSFLKVDVLQPKVLFVQYVSDKLLKDVAATPAAVRAAVERERRNPALFEDLCVCIRMNDEKQ